MIQFEKPELTEDGKYSAVSGLMWNTILQHDFNSLISISVALL